MYHQLFMCLVFVASLSGAPTPDASQLLTQQYVVFTGPQLPAQHQFHYEPLVKLQQPLFQQITPLGRLETPQKQQLLVLYPNGPLTQYPLLSLRQDGGSGGPGGSGGDFWQNIANFFQNIGSGLGVTEAPTTTDPAGQPSGGDSGKLNSLPEAPFKSAPIPDENPAAGPLVPHQALPASTELLSDRRFYILSNQPQFFGKYNAIPAPLNSVFQLQPLQTVQGRSAEPLAQPEASATSLQFNVLQTFTAPVENIQLEQSIPAASPLLQARSELLLEKEPLSDILAENEQLPSHDEEAKDTNRALLTPEGNESPQESARVVSEGRAAIEDEVVEEQSVAQAKPTAIALAGKGGVASSKPIATAVVGDNGLALAAPTATALSGDFTEEDDVKADALKFD